MLVRFSKMHSLGNDFVVIDGIGQKVEMTRERAARIADRRRGIGCDQVLVACRATDPASDFDFRIFNTDGSESSQCGNGARCFARFLRRQELSNADTIRVATSNTSMTLNLLNDGGVCVDMGAPVFESARIPFESDGDAFEHTLEAAGASRRFAVLSMGNPHAVTMVEDVDVADVDGIGTVIECHPRFPERTNVGFMQVVDRGSIRLRVFERGVGETMACGSGACAAMVSGRKLGLLDEVVTVHLPGGKVEVAWRGNGEPVFLSGDSVHVFDGEIEIP